MAPWHTQKIKELSELHLELAKSPDRGGLLPTQKALKTANATMRGLATKQTTPTPEKITISLLGDIALQWNKQMLAVFIRRKGDSIEFYRNRKLVTPEHFLKYLVQSFGRGNVSKQQITDYGNAVAGAQKRRVQRVKAEA